MFLFSVKLSELLEGGNNKINQQQLQLMSSWRLWEVIADLRLENISM